MTLSLTLYYFMSNATEEVLLDLADGVQVRRVSNQLNEPTWIVNQMLTSITSQDTISNHSLNHKIIPIFCDNDQRSSHPEGYVEAYIKRVDSKEVS